MQAPVGVKLPSGPAVQGHPVATAFSPDGSVVATGGQDGKVRLWPVAATPDPEPHVLPGDGAPIAALAISRDGRWLAAGRDDGVLELWDLTAPDTPHTERKRHALGITAMAFSPDGRLATASDDSTVLLWNPADPSDPTALPGYDSSVLSLAFSADGTKLVTGGNDQLARVWTMDDIASGPTTLRGHGKGVRAVAFSPDGRLVATGSEDGQAAVWDLAHPTAPRFLPHHEAVLTVAFSGDGRWLATGSKDDAARLWDLDAPDPAATPIVLPHDDDVLAVAFSGARSDRADSSRWLVTGSSDSTARRYDLDNLQADPLVWGGHEGPVSTVAFGAGDRWVSTGSDDGTARLWSLEHPSIQPAVLDHGLNADGTTLTVTAIAFGADGRHLATGASDKVVRVWDLDDPAAAPVLIHHDAVAGYEDAGITALALSPDGRWLATGSGDTMVRLWDLHETSPEPHGQIPFDATVVALAFSPDSRHLAVGVKDATAFLVDTDDLSATPTPLEGHEDVTSVAYSADGTQLATGSRDGTVAIWDPRDLGAEARTLPGGEAVTSLAFSSRRRPAGRRGRLDGTALGSGCERLEPEGRAADRRVGDERRVQPGRTDTGRRRWRKRPGMGCRRPRPRHVEGQPGGAGGPRGDGVRGGLQPGRRALRERGRRRDCPRLAAARRVGRAQLSHRRPQPQSGAVGAAPPGHGVPPDVRAVAGS